MSQKRHIKAITIDYTTLSSWRKCPTFFRYKYLEALSKISTFTPEETQKRGSPLEFGRLIHRGLELWHAGGLAPGDVLDAVYMEAARTELVHVTPDGDRNIPHLQELLHAYCQKYPDPHGDFTPVERDGTKFLEYAYEFKLGTVGGIPITWKQHWDGLVMQKDGSHAVLEHKTASGDPRGSFSDRMLPNDQAIAYSLGASLFLGVPTTPVLFNGISSDRNAISEEWRKAQADRHAKNPTRFKPPFEPFLRCLINITPEHHAEWLASALRDVRRLIEDIQEASFSRNAPDACTVFNRRCAFSDLCKFTGQARSSMLEFQYEKLEPWKGFVIEWEPEESEEPQNAA